MKGRVFGSATDRNFRTMSIGTQMSSSSQKNQSAFRPVILSMFIIEPMEYRTASGKGMRS